MVKIQKALEAKEEGSVYVTSGGRVFVDTEEYNYEKVSKSLQNVYIRGALTKQQRTLFRDRKDFAINLIDSEGNIDIELSRHVLKMCSQPEVDIWTNMQKAWLSGAEWGQAVFNPVWAYEGNEYRLVKLRHLPSPTFVRPGMSMAWVKNTLLPGISINQANELELWQTQSNGIIRKLENAVMLVDPTTTEFGGTPLIKPVLPVVNMLSFSWVGQMQQNNRLGAGGLFYIKVVEPEGDDTKYAQQVVQNINRGVAFQLRGNMELVNLGLNETRTAMDTIDALDRLIKNYFSPSSDIRTEGGGALIGGAANAELELYLSYIRGQQSWIEVGFGNLLRPWLDVNGYEGYEIQIDIPEPSVDKHEQYLKIVKDGYETKSMTTNERRKVLSWAGVELEELDPIQLSELESEFAGSQSTPTFTMKSDIDQDAVSQLKQLVKR